MTEKTQNLSNAGKGRPKGSRNKLTAATLDLLKGGESPLALLVKVSQDANEALPIRLNAARWAAPFMHPRPSPEMPTSEFNLREDLSKPKNLRTADESKMRIVASGALEVPLAKDLSTIVEIRRRLVETVELEARIAKLEEARKL